MITRRQWHEHEGRIVDSIKEYDIIECKNCGFKHIVPIPTEEELRAVYANEYYFIEKPLFIEHQREDLEWWNMVYAERYVVFEQELPPDRRRLVDIGSGPGFFLSYGQDHGWDTLGIEPSLQAVEHARSLGLTIANNFLNETNVNTFGLFDVVHMHEVLEHVPDPRQMLCFAHRLLFSKGLLCVIVPNDYNPIQKILREQLGYQPWWVAPPHHINYFNFNSLEQLIQAAGFRLLKRTTSFPIDLFLLMGDNYVGNDVIGRTVHGKRKRLELILSQAGRADLKNRIYENLALLDVGREVVIYARRLE